MSAPVEYNRDAQSVAFFNDAVFAIAMTLLVFEITVPAATTVHTLGHALRDLRPAFASYGVTFVVIGLYWLGHHRQMAEIERLDGRALVIDLAFLMSIAFLPFPSLLLNRFFGTISVIFYASCMAATGILLGTMWVYASRRGLLRERDPRLVRYYTARAAFPPLIFLLSIPVAIAAPRVAPYLWLVIFLGRPILRRVAYR
jgi:uncharacterized membrane protein